MSELAKAIGLSRYTVSKVLNGDPTVKPGVVERVRAACEKYQYTPNTNAVNLVRGKTKLIGLIVPEINNPFYAELIDVIENRAYELGYQLIHQCSYQDSQREARILQSFTALNICGLIIAPCVNDPNLKLLAKTEAGLPVIYIDRYLQSDSHYIINDNAYSARQVTEHLIQQNTKPVYLASVLSKNNTAINARLGGYQKTMQQYDLEPNVVQSATAETHDSAMLGYQTIKHCLQDGQLIESLFCATDSVALGASKAFYDHGVIPGKDVLIAGHDDLPFAEFSHPSLTTIRQPKQQIGQTAVEQVIHLTENPSATRIKKKFKGELIVRQSA